MSILPALKQLKTTLLEDADLTAFCHANFGKKLTIKRSFRDREEIGMDECPIILITRPSVERESGLNRRSRGIHSARLYFGFYQPDTSGDSREAGTDTAVEFEELIEAALSADTTLNGTVSAIIPGSSVNDEGTLHPIYFGVMDVALQKRL